MRGLGVRTCSLACAPRFVEDAVLHSKHLRGGGMQRRAVLSSHRHPESWFPGSGQVGWARLAKRKRPHAQAHQLGGEPCAQSRVCGSFVSPVSPPEALWPSFASGSSWTACQQSIDRFSLNLCTLRRMQSGESAAATHLDVCAGKLSFPCGP